MVTGNNERERIRLTLHGWGSRGDTLARYNGSEVRVFGGIPGEEVVVEVIRRKRDYIAARVVEVLTPSPHRTDPPCSYFGACTGCQWQHVDYTHQLELKRQIVQDSLMQVGGLEAAVISPTIPAAQHYEYRNHARFTVGRKRGDIGFVNRESRSLVPVAKCLLMDPGINQCLESLLGKCSETTQLSIRYGVNTGDIMVQPSLKNEALDVPTGQKSYLESLAGRQFRIAAASFFQVNTRQAELVARLVEDGLQLRGEEIIVDAYAGVGTFAVLLAPMVGKVIAIEEAASAVRDAEANAGGLDNIEFRQGKTEEVLAQLDRPIHGVVLDPPRVGCHPATLAALVNLRPRRVVYVSCEPEALARDLNVLCEGPFRLESVQPVDMFPQTHHVECVATLAYDSSKAVHRVPQRGKHWAGEDGIVLASTSPRRRELLAGLGVEFKVEALSGPEEIFPNESPEDAVKRLALSKATRVTQPKGTTSRSALVVGADSVVVLEGRILGKPRDSYEAREMLIRLRGKEHQVITGVAIVDSSGQLSRTVATVSKVTMREYSDAEIDSYVDSGAPLDKAGAYGVQDRGFQPAASVEGCYTNVVGLPLCRVVDMLRDLGYESVPQSEITVPDECRLCPLKGSR